MIDNTKDFVDAQILTNQLMMCRLPDFVYAGNTVLTIRASLTNSLRSLSWSSANIHIVSYAPKGYYFEGTIVMPCPKGAYCPGRGMEDDFILCPMGHYSD